MLIRVAILIFLSIVWGTTWSFIKISLDGLPPFSGAAARFITAILLLTTYALIRGAALRLPAGTLRFILFSSFLVYPLDYGLIYWAEQYLDSGVTAIFFATFPLFTGLCSNFLFRTEPFRWNVFLGLIVGLAGITVVFSDQLLQTDFDTMVIWASIAVLISAFATAISVLVIKKYLTQLSAITLTVQQMLYGVLMLVVMSLVAGEVSRIQLTLPVIGAVLYLGLIGSALAFVLYYYLLKSMSAVSLSLIIYVTPVVAVFTGAVFLNERITVPMVLGSLVVLAGIAVSQLHLYRHRRLRVRTAE